MVTMQLDNDGVDVIIRFHDPRRAPELGRAIFSIVGQQLRPLRILLMLQRFTQGQQHDLMFDLGPVLSLPDAPELTVVHHDFVEPLDARSVLVNLGFAAARARYIAILDYDDVLYPEAYRLLRDRLIESGRAIAFGNIVLKRVDVYSGFLYAPARRAPFKGRQLTDLFRLNFCPIHSFLVDRKRVPGEELRFEPALTIEEDYEFLLRVCARVASDFALVDTEIGEYNFKNDSSNTYARDGKLSDATRARIEAAIAFNEKSSEADSDL